MLLLSLHGARRPLRFGHWWRGRGARGGRGWRGRWVGAGGSFAEAAREVAADVAAVAARLDQVGLSAGGEADGAWLWAEARDEEAVALFACSALDGACVQRLVDAAANLADGGDVKS